LREDRRHIQDRDLWLLRETVPVRLNLEMAATEEILAIAVKVRPDEVTLVPERRQELTTEGGLDIVAHESTVRAAVERLRSAGMVVSLFIDPSPVQIEAAVRSGANAVELQTATYSEARDPHSVATQLEQLRQAARLAAEAGLQVHMGHGLNYVNVKPIAAIPQVEELNIGHSIVARAVLVGMERAVREMKEIVQISCQLCATSH
jgi:pyridoxine 5-phosphate synthase